jgi:hypothetical protein
MVTCIYVMFILHQYAPFYICSNNGYGPVATRCHSLVSRSPDSRSPDSRSPDSRSPDSRSPDSHSPDSRSPDSRSRNSRSLG